MKKTHRKRKVIIVGITSFFLIIGSVLYALANRYLIEHVQIDDIKQYESSLLNTGSDSTSYSPQSSGTETSSVISSESSESGSFSSSVKVVSDDWNYISDSTSIHIEKVTTGSGSSTVTYYVADVALSNATDLRSAFAKDKFGANIVQNTSVIAENNNAIFAINGDYYGFRDDGIIIRNGVIYRDEPARAGLAFYKDGTMKVYDETKVAAEELIEDGVWNTLSFGPVILINSAIPSNIESIEVDTNFGNHSIQGNQPRTGVGIIDENHFIFIVVDGRSAGYSKGVTMTEFAKIFKEKGCTIAYNLDGGGSSTMYFSGRVVNNPLGKNQERGVSDILYIA